MNCYCYPFTEGWSALCDNQSVQEHVVSYSPIDLVTGIKSKQAIESELIQARVSSKRIVIANQWVVVMTQPGCSKFAISFVCPLNRDNSSRGNCMQQHRLTRPQDLPMTRSSWALAPPFQSPLGCSLMLTSRLLGASHHLHHLLLPGKSSAWTLYSWCLLAVQLLLVLPQVRVLLEASLLGFPSLWNLSHYWGGWDSIIASQALHRGIIYFLRRGRRDCYRATGCSGSEIRITGTTEGDMESTHSVVLST